MFPNRANIGHGNVVATMITLGLILSILSSSQSIVFGQGPLAGQVQFNHPVFSNKPIIAGQINHQTTTSNQGSAAGQVQFNHPMVSKEVPAPVQTSHQATTSNQGSAAGQVQFSHPITSSQGPRQLQFTHPVTSSQGPVSEQGIGHYRCSDGSLVGQASECTYDECPASAGNHLVQCSPEIVRHNQDNDRSGQLQGCADTSSHFFRCHEFPTIKRYVTEKVFNKYFQYNTISSSSISPFITITTDKNVYNIGDNVKIFFQNTGSQSLDFTSANSLFVVRNLGTGQSVDLNMDTPFLLSPGEMKTVTWNQLDTAGHPVNPGNYIVTLYWGKTSNSVEFSISG